MAPKRHQPKSFPVATFVQQYNAACHGGIQAGQVRVKELRSRKHATAEVSIPRDAGDVDVEQMNIIVAKYFADDDKEMLRHECAVNSHAASAGIPVPRILHVLDNFLVLERVEGGTLMDLVNDGASPLERKKEAATSLGAWLGSFHKAFASNPSARRRGDANLRNFIQTASGNIIGFDFEEAGLDDPSRDLHEAIDSILQSNPGIFSDRIPAIEWKFNLCACLFRGYAISACKSPREVINDPTVFVDSQIQVMKDLATIRGMSASLIPLIPTILRELRIAVQRFLSGNMC